VEEGQLGLRQVGVLLLLRVGLLRGLPCLYLSSRGVWGGWGGGGGRVYGSCLVQEAFPFSGVLRVVCAELLGVGVVVGGVEPSAA